VRFDCALFTNLSHDHLDYHGSMEAYARRSAAVRDAGLACAVLNLDDVVGVRSRRASKARRARDRLQRLGARSGEYLAATASARRDGDRIELGRARRR
jgi:UDP-N-acetylmuramoyl-L-alanyl-D-glutamate--2,6-diaminopimelate ligase